MVTILDGGMGDELHRRGITGRTALWSAQALIDDPEGVVQTHLDYISAGARMIITNSYSTVPSYLRSANLGSAYGEMTAFAGQLARRAADESGEEVSVAGSLPPLSESYRPDLVPPDDGARPIYAGMARALEPYVDLFICETMSSAREGRNAAVEAERVAVDRRLPVYVSWTLNENPVGELRSGETIAEAFGHVADLDIDGYLFNCTYPEAIEKGLQILNSMTDKPIGGYPNRYHVPENWTLGEKVSERSEPLSTRLFVEGAMRAFEAGATIYGGCCSVGPDDIAALAEAVGDG
ncbi:MAG: homocysteine S-methyltransferase family protein [Actinomycetota bacterium]|nr:homocysteine S-methyltransferase family protein [Actinomycetota bacterium]